MWIVKWSSGCIYSKLCGNGVLAGFPSFPLVAGRRVADVIEGVCMGESVRGIINYIAEIIIFSYQMNPI
jgi:hypothetical protein